MAFNFSKLIGRIVEKFGTRYAFASAMGIGKNTLSAKLSNESEFTQTEIAKACELLSISEEEMYEYFFTKEVQSIEHSGRR